MSVVVLCLVYNGFLGIKSDICRIASDRIIVVDRYRVDDLYFVENTKLESLSQVIAVVELLDHHRFELNRIYIRIIHIVIRIIVHVIHLLYQQRFLQDIY